MRMRRAFFQTTVSRTTVLPITESMCISWEMVTFNTEEGEKQEESTSQSLRRRLIEEAEEKDSWTIWMHCTRDAWQD